MSRQSDSWVQRAWYSGSAWFVLLLPLSAVFAAVTSVRRMLYRRGWLRSFSVPVPVIVVGNISVGGTGKTPVTIWLAQQLRERGFNPGVVSRGYGGVLGDTPVQVSSNSDPDITGDEPILIATRSRCPVVVHPDRIAAARDLVAMGVDVIIADDGLQHYRMQRQFEIAVVDGARAFGNGFRLPAGPLREATHRLDSVDWVLVQYATLDDELRNPVAGLPSHTSGFHLAAHELQRIDGTETCVIDDMRGRPLHAVAAIGNPERFFRMLERHGLTIERHAFPDHAVLSARDIAYDDDHPVIMTEKDAVKCRAFAAGRHWFVPVDVDMHDSAWLDKLEHRLRPDKAAASP
ncbi:MAG: tetraacyldisaccharide 4'-kinase [Woeseia sp.]